MSEKGEDILGTVFLHSKDNEDHGILKEFLIWSKYIMHKIGVQMQEIKPERSATGPVISLHVLCQGVGSLS